MLYKKHYKKTLVLLGLFLLCISVSFHSQQNHQACRILRAIISFSFLAHLYYLHRNRTSTLLAVFLLFFGTSSLLSVWYELPRVAEIMLGLNFLSFMCLILYLKPKISRKKMTTLYWSILMILILINGYLLYQLIEMIQNVDEQSISYIFMLISAFGMVLLGMTTLLYNCTLSTTASLIFTTAIFALIFAEVFRAIGYYDFAYGNFAIYIARALLILSSALLVHYTVVNDQEKTPKGKQFL